MPDLHTDLHEAVNDAITRAIGIVGLLGIALIHVLQLPDAFDAQLYVGLLFVGAIVAAVALAALMTRTSDPRVLSTAGGLAGLVLIGYLLSRTSGLPGFTSDIGEWSEPLGLASLVVEGLLVSLAVEVAQLHRRPQTAVSGAQQPSTSTGSW